MGELENYSIETDQTVLLAFRDGTKRRVSVDRLPVYLEPRDLAKVRAALRLRRDFIRRHMPKTALVLAAGGLVALFAVSGRLVATVLQSNPGATSDPDRTAIVRSAPLPEPSEPPASVPSGTPQPVAAATPAPKLRVHNTVAKHRSLVQRVIAKLIQPSSLATPAALPSPPPTDPPIQSPTPTPTPLPSSSPAPIADNNPPANQPAPTPAPDPNQGEVLGDSTGPGDTPQIP